MHMMKRVLALLLLAPLAASAQFIQWTYEDVVTDTYQGCHFPDMVTDVLGNSHLTYWNEQTDRLMYGQLEPGATTVQWEVLNANVPSGLRSAITLDQFARPHIAYFGRGTNDEMYIYYTYKNSSNVWVHEQVSTASVGTYSQYTGYTGNYYMPSIDLELDVVGNPVIIYFNFQERECLGYVGSNFLQLWRAYKNNGAWVNSAFQNVVSYFPGATRPLDQCYCKAEVRYGEWVQLRRNPINGLMRAVCSAICDGELWQWDQTGVNMGSAWSLTRLDSTYRAGLDSPTGANPTGTGPTAWPTRDEASWEGIATGFTPDTTQHVLATISQINGWNISGNVFNPVVYIKTTKAGVRTKKTLVFGNADNDYRTSATFAYVGNDSLFFVYANRTKGKYTLVYSLDGGDTFQGEDLYTAPGAVQRAPLSRVGDSLVVIVPDVSTGTLWRGARPHSLATAWQWVALTRSEQTGNQLATLAEPVSGDTLLHLVYTDDLNNILYYRQKVAGVWSAPVPVASGSAFSHVSLHRTPITGTLHLVYIRVSDNTLHTAQSTDGINWVDVIIYNTTNTQYAAAVADASSSTLHYVFNDNSGKRILYRARNTLGNSPAEEVQLGLEGTNPILLGEYPNIKLDDNGRVHVSYWDHTNGRLIWAMRTGINQWVNVEVAYTIENEVVGMNGSMILGATNQPIITHRNLTTNELLTSWRKGTSSWTHSTIAGGDIVEVGTPLLMWTDSNKLPWLMYNNSTLEDYLTLARMNSADSTWELLAMPQQAGKLGTSFHVSMLDSSMLYVAARKNNPNNRGIGLMKGTFFPKPNDDPAGRNLAAGNLKASLYPNPTASQTTLQLQLTEQTVVALRLTDLQGRVLKEQQHNLQPGIQAVTQPLDGLAPGTYLCHLQAGDRHATLRLVVL